MPTSIVQGSRISLAFGGRDILKDVNLFLTSASRSAIAGPNGSGKTTLLKIIAGKIKADAGELAVRKDCRIAYLPQAGMVPPMEQNRTLRGEAETAYERIRVLLAKMETIGRSLESAKSDDGATAALLEEYQRIHEAVEQSDYYDRERIIAMTLKGLGFEEADFPRKTGEFSGGWQMRINLAKVLLESPDLLLLDEPTNYLDIEARTWLEEWLAGFQGGYLLVSHDRYFLDLCVNEVCELFQARLKRYAGNYSAYETVRQQEIETLMKRYAEQQEEIAKSEDLIRRFRYKATKAAMVQERIKRLEKMERIEIPESLKKISISFPPPPHSGRAALTLEGIGKRYGAAAAPDAANGGRRVLAGLNLSLDAGEKLVVAGRNGAGKSTLLRIIAGADSAYEGKVIYGTGIVPAYFSQDSAETLSGPEGSPADGAAGRPPDAAVLEYMEARAPTALMPRVRDMLGAFLFRGDDVYKSLSVLSGGEKSRLALLGMLLKPANLLILDEPTNHLDLHSKDILLDALRQFTGTVIFVSHDRAFMEALSTKTLELKAAEGEPARGSDAKLYYGGYAYYCGRKADEQTSSGPQGPAPKDPSAGASRPGPPGLALPGVPGTPPKDQRRADKQRQTLIRRLKRQEEEILAVLEELEKEKAGLEAELSSPEVYSNGEKAGAVKLKLDRIDEALEAKTAEWERITLELQR